MSNQSSVTSVPTVLAESTTHERSEFTRSVEDALKKKKEEKAKKEEGRRHRELIKRLKVVYEDEDREFGSDPLDEDTIVNRFTVATNLRKKRIEEVFRSIRRARNVQLCFVVDCTGSMSGHLNGVRTSILDIVRKLTEPSRGGTPEAQSMQLAFVAYRDFGFEAGSAQFEVLPFVPDVAQFSSFCARLCVSGGGDAEDVLGGLEKALQLRWSEECGTKVIFHIGDMPCHGREFQRSGFSDSYPNGDPNTATTPLDVCTELFSKVRQLGVQYHFGKITDETNVMIQKFSEIYGEPIEAFDIKNVVNIRDSVITAVSNSITASVSASKQTVGVVRAVRQVTLHKAKPDWSTIAEVKGTLVSHEFPARIRDIEDDIPLERNKPKVAIVKIAPHPFGKGAERIAFYGKDVSTYHDGKKSSGSADKKVVILKKDMEIVVKEYLHVGKGMNSAKRYELSNQMQTLSAYLAQEFCKDLKAKAGINRTIKFIKIRTLYLTTSPPRYMSCEKLFAATDKFVRFTNNTDYAIMEDKAVKAGVSPEFVQLVIAFSHWTYKATNRFLMVVDLEGIVGRIGKGGDTGVLLTDPAIHCTDRTRYGPMNHGPGGMKNFFASHVCNQFCRQLGLEGYAA